MTNLPVPVNPKFVDAIRLAHPQLSPEDIFGVVDVLTLEMAKGLSEGASLAIMKPQPNGKFELKVLEIRAPELGL